MLSTAGNQYVVTPNSGDTSLGVTLGVSPVGTIAGGGTVAFTGSGGTVTINGETGPGSTDVFNINDTTVQFNAADGLAGTTISFDGDGITRNVDAQGSVNTFNIQGAGASGPSGSLVGDSATNAFVFGSSSKLIGSIQGGGTSTLNDSAYSSGVIINLGNGTNGTATGVSGTVTGITGLIGTAFNDTLNAGSVAGVTLQGGLGTNTLSGTGAGDVVVEAISSSYTLTKTQLTGTGASFTDNLSGIKIAELTGVSATSNTFTVSGWTGTGSLSAPADTGIVVASKSANFTLTNASLSSGDGMSLNLTGITTADLSATSASKTFTLTGWTGNGSLADTATGMVTASQASGFTLSPTSLTAGAASLSLSGITTANLTDTAGGNTFTINGWTGAGKLTGALDTVVEKVAANVTLSNTSLAVTGIPALTLSEITTANLTDTTGGNTFTVSGWTGGGSLNDTAAVADTVTISKMPALPFPAPRCPPLTA